MATVAGVFYGLAFRRSGRLPAPAAVHALVDAVWRQFFR
jgi:membrane protease YdiL (CAAX protease family)